MKNTFLEELEFWNRAYAKAYEDFFLLSKSGAKIFYSYSYNNITYLLSFDRNLDVEILLTSWL